MGVNYIVSPCTCGRYRRDLQDLVCILEQYHKGYRGKGVIAPSQYSLVACLRPFCRGQYKTRAAFLETLPRIPLKHWQEIKRLQELGGPGVQDQIEVLLKK